MRKDMMTCIAYDMNTIISAKTSTRAATDAADSTAIEFMSTAPIQYMDILRQFMLRLMKGLSRVIVRLANSWFSRSSVLAFLNFFS